MPQPGVLLGPKTAEAVAAYFGRPQQVHGPGLLQGKQRTFVPPIRLAQFQLTADLTGSTTTGDVKTLDPTPVDIQVGATLVDPIGMFAGIKSGTKGYCIVQDQQYYILQAQCPFTF